MKPAHPSLALESTGDAALDEILGGGIPARSVVVIAGEPGSGKTVMTLQMLFHAARQGKKSLYFTTLSEPAIKVVRYLQLFDFFDQALLDEKVIFADLGGAVRQGAAQVLAELEARIEAEEPAFVVIDSFRAVAEMLQASGASTRTFIYDLAVKMASWGATTLLVGEYARAELPTLAEFAIADGIVSLGSERAGLTSTREVEIFKLRGARYLSGRHFFDIGPGGATFYPRVSSPPYEDRLPTPDLSARSGTGIAGLDALLGGGFPRGSSTVVHGATGTGKTLLALQYLLEGARAGEKGILFTFEETPEQLRAIASAVGWDLAEQEARGNLILQYTSPVELSTDRFLHRARAQIAALGARRAVFDSLTTMSLSIASDRRFKELIYAMTKHLRLTGTALLMTMEAEQLIGGTSKLSGYGVSFMADNFVQLRYLELEGRIERALSVLKARGIAHGTELKALTIGQGGLSITEGHFEELRGVLTGVPEPSARVPR